MNTINLKAFINTKDHDGYKAQTVKELMWVLSIEQHELVGCNTPEGPSDDFSWKIRLTNWFTGSSYILNTVIVGKIRSETYEDESGYSEDVVWYQNGRTTAENLIEKMKAKGVVNLDNWTRIE
ncbi:hypothetical protein [Yersinia phage MHG19]|nr:hypothetical protein [Yersinia phage MHG19]